MTPPALVAKVRNAQTLYRRGELAAAGRLCHEVLGLQPEHFAALHLLGVIAYQTGQMSQAIALLGKAIVARPGSAEPYNSLGTVLAQLGRPEAALLSYVQATTLKPDFAEAHYNHGNMLRELRRPEEAMASYQTAIRLKPDFAEVHNNLGNVLRDLGRLDAALSCYDQAIRLKPQFAEAHNNRGIVLGDLQRPSEALASFDAAIALNADFAEAHNNRGNALGDLGCYEAALAAYHKAIELQPDYTDAHDNLGAVLAGLGQFDAALSCYDRALALSPDRADTHANRGKLLMDLGRHAAAMASFQTAIGLQADHAAAHWNQSLCQLATGDFESGWENYEWRWKCELAGARPDFSEPCWTGDFPIDHKTVLVHGEQGLGDILQICRYVPMLAARAAVVLQVPRPLQRLLSGLDGVARIIAPGEPPPPFDAWIPSMSLPLAFRTTLATIPAAVPYLCADPERSANWRDRLAALPGRKIGLVWAGSPRPQRPRAELMDRRRSISLQHYAPLAAIPGLCLVSLQKGDAAAQARQPPERMVLHDWTAELDDFADTAALIAALDLVISVDTSVVHLTGALGRPVWVLNRYDQCWRWLRDRTDSPWYPTARLFRQRVPGDWSDVIRDVVTALREGQ